MGTAKKAVVLVYRRPDADEEWYVAQVFTQEGAEGPKAFHTVSGLAEYLQGYSILPSQIERQPKFELPKDSKLPPPRYLTVEESIALDFGILGRSATPDKIIKDSVPVNIESRWSRSTLLLQPQKSGVLPKEFLGQLAQSGYG